MYIDVENELKFVIDFLFCIFVKESGFFFIDEKDDEKWEKIKCLFYGN